MKKYAKEFTQSTAPQRSAEWFLERLGKPSASMLGDLFDTKRDGVTPTAKAEECLKKLAFERRFGVIYESFQTKAMTDGVFFENFAKLVYQKDTGNTLSEAHSYVSDWFVATPDAKVLENITGERGLLECKVVGNKTFMGIMEFGIPYKHELQVQGQMMASGADWVDYIVVNLKTKHYIILRILRNNKLIKRIYERLHNLPPLPELHDLGVKEFDPNLLTQYVNGNSEIAQAEELILPDIGF